MARHSGESDALQEASLAVVGAALAVAHILSYLLGQEYSQVLSLQSPPIATVLAAAAPRDPFPHQQWHCAALCVGGGAPGYTCWCARLSASPVRPSQL